MSGTDTPSSATVPMTTSISLLVHRPPNFKIVVEEPTITYYLWTLPSYGGCFDPGL